MIHDSFDPLLLFSGMIDQIMIGGAVVEEGEEGEEEVTETEEGRGWFESWN